MMLPMPTPFQEVGCLHGVCSPFRFIVTETPVVEPDGPSGPTHLQNN